MSNAFNNFGKASPAVFNNSGRPITALPGLGLGHDLAAAASAGKQNPNPAAKLKTPTPVPATAGGIQAAAQTTKAATLLSMLTKYAQGGAPVPGPAGIPPAPNSAAVVQPPPPGPVPPPVAAPSPIPANPRQQPPRERTPDDDKQETILSSILAEGEEARQLPDRSPTRELESDLMTHGKVAHDSISAFSKFAQLYKKARQDNSKPSRSAMGDSNGLSYEHRKEDHATGADAWSSLDRFRRKESNDQSFSAAFVDECVSRGMSVDQIADAIVKVGADFGEDVAGALVDDLEKQAVNWSAVGRLFNWGSKVAPAASKAAPAAAQATSAAAKTVPAATRALPQAANVVPRAPGVTENAARLQQLRGATQAAPAAARTPTQVVTDALDAAKAMPGAARTSAQAASVAPTATQASTLLNFGNRLAPVLNNPVVQRVPMAVGGGATGYFGSGEDATQAERLRNAAIGAAGFSLAPSKANRFSSMAEKGIRGVGRAAALGAAGYTTGGAIGSAADSMLRNEYGAHAPKNRNYYRDLGRGIGASAGLSAPVTGMAAAVPGAAITYPLMAGKSLTTPALSSAASYAGQQAGESALASAVPKEFLSYDADGKPRFDLDKAKNYGYETAGGFVDNYIGRKFGDIDQYVQQYTNPLFQAMGMDTAKMPAWQRYSMLGGGLMAGAGGLMQNPYMLGLGGLLGAGGMYPHLAGMANPYVQKQFGLNLPNANPYYAAAATPPAAPA